jgi:hypothetical protein
VAATGRRAHELLQHLAGVRAHVDAVRVGRDRPRDQTAKVRPIAQVAADRGVGESPQLPGLLLDPDPGCDHAERVLHARHGTGRAG